MENIAEMNRAKPVCPPMQNTCSEIRNESVRNEPCGLSPEEVRDIIAEWLG